MAYKYIGDAKLGVGLTVTTPKPLDSREVVATINDLYSIDPKYAYEGMTVANVQDGNMYMLIDKLNISNKKGWKASYESLLILACSQDEYDAMAKNTSKDFTPIDPEQSYLYPNTYYYIYEDDNLQKYLDNNWGDRTLALINLKASLDYAHSIETKVDTLVDKVKLEYLTSALAAETYAPLSDFNLLEPESFLSKTLANYYTKEVADELFVKKEELRGGIEGGADDFVFVTLAKYKEDLQALNIVLDKTIKKDSDTSLNSLKVSTLEIGIIKSTDPNNVTLVELKTDGLYFGENVLAKLSEVPKIQVITFDEYSKLPAPDPNVYYYVEEDTLGPKGMVTQETFENKTKSIDDRVNGILERLAVLELQTK